MLIGYTRVSKSDGSQSLDLQRYALRAAGIDEAANIYHDSASGVRDDRLGEFADDQPVAALEDVHQLIESAALFGSLSRGGCLDEVVDAEVVRTRGWRSAGCAGPAARSRRSNRQQFSRPDHGIRLLVFYMTDTEHGMRQVPCY